MFKIKKNSPYVIILFSFFIIIILTGSLLSLPALTVNGKGTRWIDGIFMATSAVCVTGLAVNDVSVTYNLYGKTLIMLLIQLGGLGLITFSSLFVIFISRKIGYYTKKLVQEDINAETVFHIQDYVKKIVMIVIFIELVGAFILFFEFIKIFPLKKAVYYAIFHSISAFCNAGFALFSDNMESFRDSLIVNMTIPFLIITGGLGFSTLINIWKYVIGKTGRLTTTSRITVVFSLVLTIAGTLLIFLMEYNNPLTMGNFTLSGKIGSSFFQSVTARTAGFNTVSIEGMSNATVFLLILLMFIGASPGSTGGGIKTTTAGVIFLGIISTLRNNEHLEFNKRRISRSNFDRAVAIVFLSTAYIIVTSFVLILLEPEVIPGDLIFELVSAFGTAGLSRNLTPKLGDSAKILLIITMFIGRVGPLTTVLALSVKKLRKGKYRYPEENILTG